MNQEENNKGIEKRLKKVGIIFVKTINPIQKGMQSSEKTIRLISLIFGAISIYGLITKYLQIYFIFTIGGGWDFSVVRILYPLIVLPVAVYLFWKRRKIGWILLAIYLIYSTMDSVIIFFLSLKMQAGMYSNPADLLQTISPYTQLILFVFFGSSLWTISKNNIRELYDIKKQTMYQLIGLTILIYGAIMRSILF